VMAAAAPPKTAAFSPGDMFSQLVVKSEAAITRGMSFEFFISYVMIISWILGPTSQKGTLFSMCH
jgi:hypothetical protein